jgi:hypothetical protein
MKKIIFNLSLFLLVGCSTPKYLTTFDEPPVKYSIDFSEYAKKDFLFSPESFNGNYDGIGILRFEIYNKYQYVEKEDIIDFGTAPDYAWVLKEKVYVNDLLDEIYHKCLEMGANAFVNFEFKQIEKNISWIPNPFLAEGVMVSGYAIKRK